MLQQEDTMASEYVCTEYQRTQFYKTNTTGHRTTYRSRYSKVGDSYTPLFSKDKIKSDWEKKISVKLYHIPKI